MLDTDGVQRSCGFAVPFYQFGGERRTLANWAEKQGEAGIRAYWAADNTVSLDGFETGIER